MKIGPRLSAAGPAAPRSKSPWWLFKSLAILPRWAYAGARRMQSLCPDTQKAVAVHNCHVMFFLRLDTQRWKVPAACLLLFYFSIHFSMVSVANLDVQQSQHRSSTAVHSGSGSSEGPYSSSASTSPHKRSSTGSHSAGDAPLFHILWPEEPLNLDTVLRHAAEQLKLPWGKKVLAGRLSGLTVDEADDFCRRIKFAVEKHLRMVFDHSTHFKVFDGVPTSTPFLHLKSVRDFLRSQFTRDKIKLSLPDRELEPLFKHAGGLPWRKNTDGEQLPAESHNHAEGGDGVRISRSSASWTHDEL